MDAKDLRTESSVSDRNNDGSKYSQSGSIALHCDRNKSYQDIGSNSLGKVDVQNGRPCAVIGPDRVVPPPAASESYHLKKGPTEAWSCMDNSYRRPPEYPHKLNSFQNPTRNISPRQTFQENMQRIMVPPTYNSIKLNDDTNYAQISDRSNGLSKNIKLNMPTEAKFCDVPYSVNPNAVEQKNVRNPEMCLPSVNPTLTRTASHGWPPNSVNLRSARMYGASELYQYQEYPSCAGPRPVVPRPHRTVPEEQGYVYADPYYQEGNIRFKPYPSVKERYPQQRYEYIGNYSNPFHPPPGFPPHKYELQKSMPPHPYPPYPPIKYLDSRVAEPVMEGYQRNPQGNYNIQYRNQVIHPNYGPVISNCPPSKMHSYPPDAHIKTIAPNKLPYDNNAKAYIEYENNRSKIYPPSESYFVNEMARMPMKSQVIMPNYPTLNMHNIPPSPYYKKDNQQLKNYEHMAQFRAMDPNLNIHNSMSRHAPVFSPNTLAISPTDSNTSNDTTQTHGTSQEDCGYVSQSSTASVRSMDSGINRIPNDYLRKYYDNRYGPIVRASPMMSKSQLNSNSNISKEKKQIDVRQFLQMWNEGDEETEENGSKEIILQTGSSEKNNFVKSHEAMNNQEQLYVLGLVNVPSEELAKYEHIQKVSKLPENIKGYNSIELLNQFEEVIESSNMNNYKTSKEFQMSMKGVLSKHTTGVIPPRPVSPLDVEAKISQSVIHKEVGCNFEIKPCSPKMLNVEVAAPIQNILAERSIEKVANPVMLKSPMLNGMDDNIDCNIMKRADHHINVSENVRIPSCKMINTQFSNRDAIDSIKSSYSLQDLESNSGLCLASLPRLDNDIELNFPEVNQQFINANKGDNSVLPTSLRDLPSLDVLDQPDNQIKDKFERVHHSEPVIDVNKTPNLVESEKEFSKLSKYRKTKTSCTDLKDHPIQNNINAIRTDSVIIKNPENIKNYEENLDNSCNSLKTITDMQQAPINLTSQGTHLCKIENDPDNVEVSNEVKDKDMSVEIAIDFSVNKTGILDSIEPKNESQIKTPVHLEETPLTECLLSRDEPAESNSFLPVFSERTEHFTKTDNLNDKSSPVLEIAEEKLEPIININDEKTDLNEIQSSKSCKEADIEMTKCAINDDNINIIEEMITDVSNKSLLPLNTKRVDNEMMNEIHVNDNCKTETNSNTETSSVESEDANNSLKSSLFEDPEHHTENSQEAYEMDTTENLTNVPVVDEFCDEYNLVNKLNCPKHIENNLEPQMAEVNNPSDNCHSLVADQAQSQNTHGNNLPSILPKICSEGETESLQSPNTQNSKLSDYNIMLDNINDEIQTCSSSELLEELSNHERELNEFADTQNSPEMPEECDLRKSLDEKANYQNERPVKKYLWYGSKEMYSPWIQKLLTFSEGCSHSINTKIDIDDREGGFADSIETVRVMTNDNENYNDNSGVNSTDKVAVDDVYDDENLTENFNHDHFNETINTRIIDNSIFNTSVSENNIENIVESYDNFEREDSYNVEESIVNYDEPEMGVDDGISNDDAPVVTEVLEQNEAADFSLVLSNKEDEINADTQGAHCDIIQRQETVTSFSPEAVCEESLLEVSQPYDDQVVDKNAVLESSALFDNMRQSWSKVQANEISCKKSQPLKRSMSDSALNQLHNDESTKENEEKIQFIWPFKRRKVVDNDLLAQNLCNIIHNNRRNSVSSFYNEENVSFCILIDNGCIITEEENEEPDKMCYTELSEDCIAEIQNDSMKHDEDIQQLTEVVSSPQQETPCDYSDSVVMECEEEKALEESWVEDVACVETVISDDVAEDIEICGRSSPKDDVSSDNEESGVFSSSEHTDKVKFIYGDKMCSDDALFVETLYKTPQMDVNKTLYSRESHVSEEYDRYYDNDSLEKMLSESNEPDLSPYVPEYMDSMFPSEIDNSKETPENKENMNVEPFPPFQIQNKANALDIVVDINVDKIEEESMHSIEIFAKTRNETVQSCESSIDNVFTYNQKDEDTIYTSSSPEVSSTTSEEKNSGILLKITNYKGSRISQINDISRMNKRSSCKFTEDKEYLQTHSSFPTNRPLLTKAAQKYIPPLKESIRDLKVKLSLPQHSLMKLKQLKIAKDEPKVNKQNTTISRIPKKPKPKFEDVLKSIDEIQFKMHKEKTKKTKKSIPKVVIKKTQNGSHYASTSNKDEFNPDLTGRKWQPWVFIEKNHFIDKMAIKNKTKAIYSHRKRTYVLAEKFQKYKSASSAKFVISPPISESSSSGLKYTIRLKHNY